MGRLGIHECLLLLALLLLCLNWSKIECFLDTGSVFELFPVLLGPELISIVSSTLRDLSRKTCISTQGDGLSWLCGVWKLALAIRAKSPSRNSLPRPRSHAVPRHVDLPLQFLTWLVVWNLGCGPTTKSWVWPALRLRQRATAYRLFRFHRGHFLEVRFNESFAGVLKVREVWTGVEAMRVSKGLHLLLDSTSPVICVRHREWVVDLVAHIWPRPVRLRIYALPTFSVLWIFWRRADNVDKAFRRRLICPQWLNGSLSDWLAIVQAAFTVLRLLSRRRLSCGLHLVEFSCYWLLRIHRAVSTLLNHLSTLTDFLDGRLGHLRLSIW